MDREERPVNVKDCPGGHPACYEKVMAFVLKEYELNLEMMTLGYYSLVYEPMNAFLYVSNRLVRTAEVPLEHFIRLSEAGIEDRLRVFQDELNVNDGLARRIRRLEKAIMECPSHVSVEWVHQFVSTEAS